MEIKVNTVLLSTTINQMKTQIDSLKSSLQTIQDIAGVEMHNHWQGSDYDEGFSKKITPFLEEELEDYLTSLENYQKYLEHYLEGFKSLHSHYEGKKITVVGR